MTDQIQPPDDSSDSIEKQLGRYASAAESQVAPTPHRATGTGARRRFLAAAATIVMVAGGLGAAALVRNDHVTVRSVPADVRDEPAPADCATPSSMRPDLADMRHALPFVAVGLGDESTGTADRVRVFVRRLQVRDDIDPLVIQVTAFSETTSSTPDMTVHHTATPQPVSVTMCNPFPPGGREAMEGLLSHADGATVLTVMVGGFWDLAITAASDDVTDEELFEVAAGTTWPTGPDDPTTTTDALSIDPDATDQTTTTVTAPLATAAPLGSAERPSSRPGGAPCTTVTDDQPEINGMRVTWVPQGFSANGTSQVDTGWSGDPATNGAAFLDLVDAGGRMIRVTNFWSDDPPAVVEQLVAGMDIEHLSLSRCRVDARGEAQPKRLDGVRMGQTADRIVVAGQDQGHGGFAVAGGPGVTVDEVLAVASGLE